MNNADAPLPADVRIGHVHLRVSDLDRAIGFYRDVIGFAVTLDARPCGIPAVFLAGGDYHHHIALNTFESAGGTPPSAAQPGLYHLAILYPDRASLIRAVARTLSRGAALDGGRDHGATVSVYLKDPDRNGIELYYDRPRADWFDGAGRPVLRNEWFDPRELLADVLPAPCPVTA